MPAIDVLFAAMDRSYREFHNVESRSFMMPRSGI